MYRRKHRILLQSLRSSWPTPESLRTLSDARGLARRLPARLDTALQTRPTTLVLAERPPRKTNEQTRTRGRLRRRLAGSKTPKRELSTGPVSIAEPAWRATAVTTTRVSLGTAFTAADTLVAWATAPTCIGVKSVYAVLALITTTFAHCERVGKATNLGAAWTLA